MKRYFAAVAAACALIGAASTVSAGATTSAASAGFADTTSGIHLWAPMHEPGGRFHSSAEAVAAARRYDLITIRPGQLGGYVPAMRAANPNLRIFVYINGSYLYHASLKRVSQSMLAHGRRGSLVWSNGFHNYLGSPASSRWISYKQQECRAAIADSGADGCYLDMLGSAPTFAGYNNTLAVDPATGRNWTKMNWLKATSNLAAQVAAATGKPVLGNGFGDGQRYFDPSGPSRLLLGGTTGSTAEVWLKTPRAPATSFENEAQWKQDVDMLADANQAGGVALTMTKTWGSGTTAQKQAYRLYALATFLLGNGGHSYFYFTGDRHDPATTDSSLYHLPLGSPTGTYARVGGVYQRTFSNGRVLVNPTTANVTVPLGGSYRTSGGATVTTLTLRPHTGEILTLPAS
jgi:hypothetical protein